MQFGRLRLQNDRIRNVFVTKMVVVRDLYNGRLGNLGCIDRSAGESRIPGDARLFGVGTDDGSLWRRGFGNVNGLAGARLEIGGARLGGRTERRGRTVAAVSSVACGT